MLTSGGNPRQKNITGDIPLIIAARTGKIDNVEVLAASATKEEIQSLFFTVIATGLTEGVNKMLALGANVNATNTLGETPLMLAVINRHHLIVDILLSKGASVQTVSNEGNDILMIALLTKPYKQRILTALIAKGVNLQRKNTLGNTALHIAAKQCMELDFSVIEVLVSAGAKQDDVNNKGDRARDLIADNCLSSTRNAWGNWKRGIL